MTFYGCFMGDYSKKFKWQCKAYDNEKEATQYAVEGANKADTPMTLLCEVEPYVPKSLHYFFINRFIQRIITVQIEE